MINEMITVNIFRGGKIESSHNVIAAVTNLDGLIVNSFGDIDQKIFPRSSLKPLQAMPLILTDAFLKYQLSEQELAISCASHNGEKFQTECVQKWLNRMQLTDSDLECGVHNPLDLDAFTALIKSEQTCNQLHNNCSGKHTGMLCSCLQLGVNIKGYTHVNHPIQQYIKEIIENLSDYKIPNQDYGIDGCSIPNWALPLKNFSLALAKFAYPLLIDQLKYQKACDLLYNACINNPEFIAGSNRYCTLMMLELNKKAIIKTGAEGVMAAIIRSPKPMGIALKCLDGATRAAESAMSHLLLKYGVLENSNSSFLNKKISNWNKIETGFIETLIPG